ncbi:DUF262 domain-containing protein [Corynebacterium lizhenjunii]|uniref:DUF262 domain-containing protein n=1 Tax=Corynebacterium lizhenjunii TaxID=2709394 RepID=A0A7T0PCT5_9CORY|nr:DUF262 domain-containing protein [Corynebacterium lizhenjunii]QPK80052.1 DUF262 domain-containing protein [Corynebacterium lizhenjunii]
MGFTTPSFDLLDLFARIDRGDIQLPDFQRDYAWDEDRIRSLIVTVLRGYPVGALMVLDTRNEPMRFRPRPLRGAPDTGARPGLLLLDGQQRLTTLYHCFRGAGTVRTTDFRAKRVTRTFYVDVAKAVSEPMLPDEAVFAVDESGKVSSHFGPELADSPASATPQLPGCIAVADLLFAAGTRALFELAAGELAAEAAEFHNRIMRPLAGYDVPVIRLARETERSGVGQVFAQANSSGLQMDVFDLLTAVFASEDPDFHLREHWEDIRGGLERHPALAGIGHTEFLSAVSLLVTAQRGHAAGNREDVLSLSLADYRRVAATLRVTFEEVAAFLSQRCIFSQSQVPFDAQLVPLAVILARLVDRPGVLAQREAWDKINRWFWSGVFGELYGGHDVAQRAARDVDEVVAWVLGETEVVPKTVRDATFAESRLLSATPDSGIFKALDALLMARGARDWRSGREFDRTTFSELSPGFYPVFPLAWCDQHGVDPILAQSVLNRTPMGKRTEVIVDDRSPQRYLPRVQSKSIMEDAEFDAVLASHELDPVHLHGGKAAEFFADRRRRFVGMVEHAMGKDVIRDVDGTDLRSGAEGPDAFAR